MPDDWIQIRGDPSIREFLFLQERRLNEFDERIDEVIGRVSDLVCNYGVFHIKVHFSSGQVTLWLIDDPLRYRVHLKDEFLRLNAYHTYPVRDYTQLAVVNPDCIAPILEGFKQLRTRDPQIYLRSGSVNIVNGFVGLNFSCDGSHYIHFDEFLVRMHEITC